MGIMTLKRRRETMFLYSKSIHTNFKLLSDGYINTNELALEIDMNASELFE